MDEKYPSEESYRIKLKENDDPCDPVEINHIIDPDGWEVHEIGPCQLCESDIIRGRDIDGCYNDIRRTLINYRKANKQNA